MKRHEGQCRACRIAWAWTLKILLRDQVCAQCSAPLGRVTLSTRADDTYTWMAWEGYR